VERGHRGRRGQSRHRGQAAGRAGGAGDAERGAGRGGVGARRGVHAVRGTGGRAAGVVVGVGGALLDANRQAVAEAAVAGGGQVVCRGAGGGHAQGAVERADILQVEDDRGDRGARLGGGNRDQGGARVAVARELTADQRSVAEARGAVGVVVVLVVGQQDGPCLEGVAGVGGDSIEGGIGAASDRRQC